MFGIAFRQAVELLAAGAVDLWTIIITSLRVSATATLIGMVVGVPIGFLLGGTRFVGRRLLMVLTNTGMGLPPVVVGLFVLMMLSRSGPFGFLQMLYSQEAMVIAQVVIATPLIVGVTAAAVAAVPRELRLQARSLGAGRVAEALLTIREARLGVIAAIAAGFGGIISEVGAVQIVGGNIEGQTRVMTTAIVLEARRGNFGLALALGLMLIGLALLVNVVLTSYQHSHERYERG
ncbi:MAG: ABC transporter permease [Coriobacteriia bacterium]|nr:ABC transporter permease [Coriobacteriia bacterium]